MAINVVKLRAIAQKQLRANGGVIFVTKKVTQTLNPNTGDMINASTPTPCKFYAVQMSLSESYIDGRTREWSDQYHISTEIEQAKAKVFVSPGYVDDNGVDHFDVIPNIGDEVVLFDSVTYSVIDAQPLNPNGVIVGYELTLS